MTIIERPRFTIRLAETPKGAKLVERVFEITDHSLIETYPLLQREYKDRTPTLNDIQFVPFDTVRQEEEKEIPQEKTKLDKQFAKNNLLQNSDYERYVTPEEPVYWNPDTKRTMYISDKVFEAISSDNPQSRTVATIALGLWIANRALKFLPVPQQIEPKDKRIWEEITKAHLFEMIERGKKEYQYLEEKKREEVFERFNKIQEITENYGINNPHSRFFFHGAKICVFLPEQNIKTPSYSTYEMGEEFNKGILEILMEPVYKNLLQHLSHSFLIPSQKEIIRQQTTNSRKYAQEILEAIDENCLGKEKSLSLNRDKNALFEAYASSLIPAYIYSSKASKYFNPWKYPY